MGNKTNTNIIKKGHLKNWDSVYSGKKNLEKSFYIFKDIELKKFIEKYFIQNKLFVFDIKIFYLENRIHCFISYFMSFRFLNTLKNKNNSILKKNNFELKNLESTKFKKTRKKVLIAIATIKKQIQKIKRKNIFNKLNTLSKMKKNIFYLNLKYISLLKKRCCFQKQTDFLLEKNKKMNDFLQNNFLNDFLNTISRSLKINNKISFTFFLLNEKIFSVLEKKQINFFKKKIQTLWWYSKENYFKETLLVIYLSLTSENSSKFLTTYIASQLQLIKDHKNYLSFIKQALNLFNNEIFGIQKSIIIKVSGRINGKARSSKKVIAVGNSLVKRISIDAKVDYFETTCFSNDGAIGIKIWISENYC